MLLVVLNEIRCGLNEIRCGTNFQIVFSDGFEFSFPSHEFSSKDWLGVQDYPMLISSRRDGPDMSWYMLEVRLGINSYSKRVKEAVGI